MRTFAEEDVRQKMDSTFTWIDLSTFDVVRASAFYRNVLGWKGIADATGYTNCSLGEDPCAGLYEMPALFQEIRMPSFWMTYIEVDDTKGIAAEAKKLGGNVELEEENHLGRIVLIRDPSGAGFTCYEGGERAVARDFYKRGSWCWTELMISDLGLVKDFYTTLFGWQIEQESEDRYAIRVSSGKKIGSIQVANEDVKGSKEFWAVYFAAPDLENAAKAIERAGGKVEGSYPHDYGTQILAYDDQGAAFFLLQSDQQTQAPFPQPHAELPSKNLKWRSLLGLIAIYLIVIFEQDWGWGVLFLFWALPDLKSGTTYFIEPLDRRCNPFLYWSVVLTWIALAVFLLADALS